MILVIYLSNGCSYGFVCITVCSLQSSQQRSTVQIKRSINKNAFFSTFLNGLGIFADFFCRITKVLKSAQMVSCCVCDKPPKIIQHKYDNILYMFDYGAYPVVQLILLNSSMGVALSTMWCSSNQWSWVIKKF